MQKDYVKGSIWGLAYGDAWGLPYEFKSHYEGRAALPDRMVVSDDTQMSLYVMRGVLNAGFEQTHGLHECKERKRLFLNAIGQQLVQFHDDPDNNRAPGISTMVALGKLKNLPDWAGEIQVSGQQSKGNGANIRAPWIGLLPCSLEDKECLAGLQAWITHGHPMAIYASRLTVRCIHALANGLVEQDEDLPLISWLQNSMQRDESPEAHDFLKQLDEAVVWADHIRAYEDKDIAEILGKGATADNALVNALMVMDCGYISGQQYSHRCSIWQSILQ